MKKVFAILLLAVLAIANVFATTTTLSPDEMTMDYTDVQVVTFCLLDKGIPQDVTVVVDPVCKDQNSLLGCNAGDVYNPAGFSVVPNEPTTGVDGCVDLTVTTSLSEGQEGVYYYTVNGQVAGTNVGQETGKVFVPEMGIVGAAIVLAGAGLFAARKRKE